MVCLIMIIHLGKSLNSWPRGTSLLPRCNNLTGLLVWKWCWNILNTHALFELVLGWLMECPLMKQSSGWTRTGFFFMCFRNHSIAELESFLTHTPWRMKSIFSSRKRWQCSRTVIWCCYCHCSLFRNHVGVCLGSSFARGRDTDCFDDWFVLRAGGEELICFGAFPLTWNVIVELYSHETHGWYFVWSCSHIHSGPVWETTSTRWQVI